jgi:hypothetical protein
VTLVLMLRLCGKAQAAVLVLVFSSAQHHAGLLLLQASACTTAAVCHSLERFITFCLKPLQ